jgi:hypothetical protein
MTGPSSAFMYGTITEEDARFVETWENISEQTNYVIRLDMRGDERPEGVSGKRSFMITTKERLITQDRVAQPSYDPFSNGAFRPVIVPDSVNTSTNPNALSNDEIHSIFVSSEMAWEEWMKTIDSGATLRRMLDLADGAEISLKRFRQLERRMEEVTPRRRIVQKDQEQYDALGGNAPAKRVQNPSRPAIGGM